jgi:hypothetical protein
MWHKHENQPFYWDNKIVAETVTLEELKAKYKTVQKSLRLTRFRESAEIAYQITDIYLNILPLIRNTLV